MIAARVSVHRPDPLRVRLPPIGLVPTSIVGHTGMEVEGVIEVGPLSVVVVPEVPVEAVASVSGGTSVGISGQSWQSYRSRRLSATVSLKLRRGGGGSGSIIITQGLCHQPFNQHSEVHLTLCCLG